MKDVATLAHVSVGTVSNVLNQPERVSEVNRQRVGSAIQKLGWVRNESARQLRAGRSTCIGLVIMDIANPFFSDLSQGVEEVAEDAGYSVLLTNSAQLQNRENSHLSLLQRLRVRGLIVAPISEASTASPAVGSEFPVVLADRTTAARAHCTVSVDDFQGGQMAVEHLLEQGHDIIAVVGGTSDIAQVRERREGASRSISINRNATMLTISTVKLDIAAGRTIADHIATLPPEERPTGVFAVNDLVSIGLLQGLVIRGVRVPQDVAIIGYDDIDFAAAAAVPLSSIQQPRRDIGRRAAELLLAEIEDEDGSRPHTHEQAVFVPKLIVRDSSNYRRRPSGTDRTPMTDSP